MNIPAVKGTIARRILANFRADSEVVAAQLPTPFRPKLVKGKAIVGICLIRLEKIRPALSPLPCGIHSENAAHRIAVEWDENGQTREGVFIPRRDTDSRLNHWSGGRVFPGQHHLAQFDVRESATEVEVQMRSCDGAVAVRVKAIIALNLPTTSIFDSVNEASSFFERGCLGYSARCNSNQLDGLLLETYDWRVQALDVSEIQSSVFDDRENFPQGTIEFDHALLMRGIEHQWHAAKALCNESNT